MARRSKSTATATATVVRPQQGPQEAFLRAGADIVIYGGAAGGGKTYGLLLEPLRHVGNPDFGAVIFRRSYPQIMQEGGMWDEAARIYPMLGARPHMTEAEWRFPGGARVKFAHMGHENDKFNWQGAQIPLIGWDQLEHFSESVFFYMLSRNRSMSGVRPYVRATVNPDAESWLAKFLAWWIAEDGYPLLERAGRVRWFVRVAEKLEWADSRRALLARFPGQAGELIPKSVTFIPATVYDNKILLARDPGYLANLQVLSLVDRERLLGDPVRGGNWKIKPAAGRLFDRGWFEIAPAAPAGGVECRFWDFAATAKKLAGDDPDYSAGVKIRKVAGVYYVMDCMARQAGPAEVDRMLVNLARQDAEQARAQGTQYRVRWEIEPGSAGLRENRRLAQMLAGLIAGGRRPDGDKVTRAKALAAQAEAGNVKLVAGDWNEEWLKHMHHQPDWAHDDIMDGSSGAFNDLDNIVTKEASSVQG